MTFKVTYRRKVMPISASAVVVMIDEPIVNSVARNRKHWNVALSLKCSYFKSVTQSQ